MPDPVSAGALVVLTGAGGFVAKHIGRRLLEDGYALRATLRSPGKAEEVRAALLPGLPSEAADRLSFAKADLLSDAGWPEAMAGAKALVHAASPFPPVQPRDPHEVLRPAIEGTRRALRAADQAGIRRVVLTSSVSAIRHPGPPEVQDERDWLDPDVPGTSPYDASKALAERAAWDLARERGLHLTAICPALVLGPLLDEHVGTSAGLVQRLLRGVPLVPQVNVSVVDARDVALMHARALALPATAGERIIAAAGYLPAPAMARVLRAAYPGRRIGTRPAPDWILRLLAPMVPGLNGATAYLGRRDIVSNAKARALFGLDFIPPEEALLATAESLIAKGLA